MSLLMDALKKAEQAKSRSHDPAVTAVEPVAIQAEMVVPEAPPACKKVELMLEVAAPVEPVVETELSFSIDSVEPLVEEAQVKPVSTVVMAEPQQPSETKSADRVAARLSEMATPKPVGSPLSQSAVQEVVSPPKKGDTVAEKIDVKTAPPRQVPIMIGKPKINRNYLWGALLLLLFFAGLGYYFLALNGDGHENSSIAPLTDVGMGEAQTDEVADNSAPQPAVNVVAASDKAPSPLRKTESNVSDIALARSQATPSSELVPQTKSLPLQKPRHPAEQNRKISNVTDAEMTGADTAPVVKVQPLQVDKIVIADPLQSLLESAYSAYNKGDLGGAAALYQQVQQREANNRDALLGLAVIAQHQGEPNIATNLYGRLLTLNPKDSVAAAGMASLKDNGMTTQGVSHLKLLLQEEPTAAHLHFSLANEYAALSRWPEAQQAYFQAYRYAPEQADYAFNLAVSLEKLGQPQAALEYYRRALEAAKQSQASFDRQQLIKRIDTLAER